jgi:hypothetical protein
MQVSLGGKAISEDMAAAWGYSEVPGELKRLREQLVDTACGWIRKIIEQPANDGR